MAVKNQKENKLCVFIHTTIYWRVEKGIHYSIQVIHILGKLDLMYLVEEAEYKKKTKKRKKKHELRFLLNFPFFIFVFVEVLMGGYVED